MKQLHMSQRSGNFGGRKRRAVGDASEDTEEVVQKRWHECMICTAFFSQELCFKDCFLMCLKLICKVPSIMESGSGALQWVKFLLSFS